MKSFHCDKDDNNDDFIEMEIANESGNREEKELRCFQVQKERNFMQLLVPLKELCDSADK